MTMWTYGPATVLERDRPIRVLFRRNCLQMSWPAAALITAEMVYLHPLRYWAAPDFISDSMSAELTIFSAILEMDATISSAQLCAGPFPTSRTLFIEIIDISNEFLDLFCVRFIVRFSHFVILP